MDLYQASLRRHLCGVVGVTKGDTSETHMQLDGEPWPQTIPAGDREPLKVRCVRMLILHPSLACSRSFMLSDASCKDSANICAADLQHLSIPCLARFPGSTLGVDSGGSQLSLCKCRGA